MTVKELILRLSRQDLNAPVVLPINGFDGEKLEVLQVIPVPHAWYYPASQAEKREASGNVVMIF